MAFASASGGRNWKFVHWVYGMNFFVQQPGRRAAFCCFCWQVFSQDWRSADLSRAVLTACRLFPLMGGGSCNVSGFCGFREKDLAKRPESGYNSATIAKEVML